MPAIEFTGVPFMFAGSKRLVCHQGKDLAVAQKQRYAEEKAKNTVSFLCSQHTNTHGYIKLGAVGGHPAVIGCFAARQLLMLWALSCISVRKASAVPAPSPVSQGLT